MSQNKKNLSSFLASCLLISSLLAAGSAPVAAAPGDAVVAGHLALPSDALTTGTIYRTTDITVELEVADASGLERVQVDFWGEECAESRDWTFCSATYPLIASCILGDGQFCTVDNLYGRRSTSSDPYDVEYRYLFEITVTALQTAGPAMAAGMDIVLREIPVEPDSPTGEPLVNEAYRAYLEALEGAQYPQSLIPHARALAGDRATHEDNLCITGHANRLLVTPGSGFRMEILDGSDAEIVFYDTPEDTYGPYTYHVAAYRFHGTGDEYGNVPADANFACISIQDAGDYSAATYQDGFAPFASADHSTSARHDIYCEYDDLLWYDCQKSGNAWSDRT